MLRRSQHREPPQAIVWLSLAVFCRWVWTENRGVILDGPWYAWPRIECLLNARVGAVIHRPRPRLRWEAHSGFC